jgi:hypothetical protein
MDRLDSYRDLIEKIMTQHAEIPFPIGELECKTVFDRDKDSYLLLTIGWNNGERIYHVVTHVDVIDGKLWVQNDVTEGGIATELVAEGVPKDVIVLGFHEPEVRPYTEFAAA